MTAHRLGGIEINRILEMEGPFLPLLTFFPDATEEMLAPHREWLMPGALDARDRLVLPVQSYLVRTEHHTILIDACVGNHKSFDGIRGWNDRRATTWMDNLRAAGVTPADIDYVFCTHLHVDHCGWNTSLVDGRWVPTFPNAKYLFARPEYEASERGATSVFQENVLPIMEAGQAELVEMDHALDDQVWLEPTPGHTTGHVAVNLASQGHRAAMCGDLIHSPFQLVFPDLGPGVDRDAEQARRTRRRFLEQHADTGNLIMTAHFPSPSMGHLVSEADRFRFDYVEE